MSWLRMVAELGLNINPFVQGLLKARTEASAFGNSVGKKLGEAGSSIKGQIAAAFTVGALAGGAKSIIELGGHIEDLHNKIGISRHDVQALDYALGQSGGSIEDVGKAMKSLALAREAALGGDKDRIEDFKRLAISIEQLKTKDTLELFTDIARYVKNAGDSGQYLTSVLGVMGGKSDAVIPAMRDGIADAIEAFDRLGLAIEDSVVRRLDKVGDEWDQLIRKMKKDVAPFLAGAIDSAQAAPSFLQALFGGGLGSDGFDPSKVNQFFEQRGIEGFFDALSDSFAGASTTKSSFSEKAGKPQKPKLQSFDNELLGKEVPRYQQDALAGVGGFVGGSFRLAQQTDLAREQLKVQRQIAKNTDPANANSNPDKFSYQ